MKIIQTFWTAGQDPLKHSFGWTHPEYNLMSWALSCLSLREHYDEVGQTSFISRIIFLNEKLI